MIYWNIEKRSSSKYVTLPKFHLICNCILMHVTICIFASDKVRQFRTGLFNMVGQRYLILVLFYRGGLQIEHADVSGGIAAKIGLSSWNRNQEHVHLCKCRVILSPSGMPVW